MNLIRLNLLSICFGTLLDLLLGDPEKLLHPVVIMGRLISFLEEMLYTETGANPDHVVKKDYTGKGSFHPEKEGKNRDRNTLSLFLRGLLLVILLLSATALTSAVLLFLSFRISPLLYLLVSSVISWQCLAARSLRDHAMRVYTALNEGDIKQGQKALSMIVGRDTAILNEDGIIRASVESVAESSSDGVIAPLFYLSALGPVGGLIYKAVNTMDSMIGYRNERYEYFGKSAARLDDIFNFIPSRLTAVLMITAAFFLKGCSGINAFKTWCRDRKKHKSPNAGEAEAAASGALSLRLSGPAVYKGIRVVKPYIGEEYERNAERKDILLIIRIMYFSFFTAVLGILAIWYIKTSPFT